MNSRNVAKTLRDRFSERRRREPLIQVGVPSCVQVPQPPQLRDGKSINDACMSPGQRKTCRGQLITRSIWAEVRLPAPAVHEQQAISRGQQLAGKYGTHVDVISTRPWQKAVRRHALRLAVTLLGAGRPLHISQRTLFLLVCPCPLSICFPFFRTLHLASSPRRMLQNSRLAHRFSQFQVMFDALDLDSS